MAAWALDGALDDVGDDPTPSMDTVVAVMAAKREIALAGIEVCDIAMDLGGGAAFFKGSPIERCLPRHPGGQVPPASRPRRRWCTPAGSPSASPPTCAERW